MQKNIQYNLSPTGSCERTRLIGSLCSICKQGSLQNGPDNQEENMSKKPFIDQEICIACELCVSTAPGVFRMNDENLAEVFDPLGDPEEIIQEAIDNCPVNCISWE
jgi:ferredoxin